MHKVRLGIIGAGRIGRVHAASVSDPSVAAVPLAITDINRSAAAEVAGLFGIPQVVNDASEIFDNNDIDAVLICSSTNTHSDLICQAARARKHIFCEKPIDYDLSRIDRALEAVQKAGVKLQIGFNRRFDPNFARVRKAVESGEIGTPRLLHIISRDPAPPPIAYIKVSGGMFFDMTIHDFDMARFLIQDEVEEIYAAAGNLVDPEIGRAGDVDTAVITLKFKNGVIGTIDNSREAAYGYDQRVEILGSKGSISTGNCYPNQAIISTGKEIRRDLPLNFFMDRYAESFARELKAFVNAVVEDKPTPVTGHDGRMPVIMGMAAKRSYQEGRPVKLQELAASVAK
ncbi:MAG TPA: inositol 2-dehydrogenase [Terriglobales bacterium]|nr:inositol 2-dehydrogenase [Terriglobales bacterium]